MRGGVYGFDIKLPVEYFTKYNPDNATSYTIWWIQIGSIALPRIRATFGDPTLCGGFLVSVAPLITSLAFYRMSGNKGYLQFVIFALLIISAIVATFSRSALGGLIIALVIVFVYWQGRFLHRKLFMNMVKIGILGMIVIGIAMTALPVKIKGAVNPALIAQRLQHTFQKDDESTSIHLKLAKQAFRMWSENPFLGVGLGNFGSHLGLGYSETSMSHSAILSFFAETGLVGAAANFTLIVALILYLTANIKYTEKYSYWYAVNVGLLAGYAGSVSGNLTYHYYNQAYLWFLMGFIVAVAQANRKERCAEREKMRLQLPPEASRS